MAFSIQWPRFSFYEKKTSKIHSLTEKINVLEICSCASGHGQMLFCMVTGEVAIISRTFEVRTFQAHELQLDNMHYCKQNNILLTVGADASDGQQSIKVWLLSKVTMSNFPYCSRIMRVPISKVESQVSAIAIDPLTRRMALGFNSGKVIVYKSNVTRDRNFKYDVIHETKCVITNLSFSVFEKQSILFITSDSCVISVYLTNRSIDKLRILDSIGCQKNCCTVVGSMSSFEDGQFIIGTMEGIYFYCPETRGSCLGFEGEKLLVQWFNNYMIVVTKEKRSFLGSSYEHYEITDVYTVNVYDLKNKFVACSIAFSRIASILCEWGSIYVLQEDGKLFELIEKDMQSKLDILFRKNMWPLAIDLAQTYSLKEENLVDIYKKYGDHLFNKKEYQQAVDQYVHTIGYLEPSYVIKKLLNANEMEHLTHYLMELQAKNDASNSHTNLLLDCLIKTNRYNLINDFFIKNDANISFDIDAAVDVCRQFGLYEQALYLSKQHSEEKYLEILVCDVNDIHKSITYLMEKPVDQTVKLLKEYFIKFSSSSDDFIDLMIHVCSSCFTEETTNSDILKELLTVFSVKEPKHGIVVLEGVLRKSRCVIQFVANALLELYLSQLPFDESLEVKLIDLLKSENVDYDSNHALLLCKLNNFGKGTLILYEKIGLLGEILQHHMDNSEYSEIIEFCKSYGIEDMHAWISAFNYFIKQDDANEFIEELLNYNERFHTLSLTLLISLFGNYSTTTLGLLKDYLIRHFQKESEQITHDEELTQSYQAEAMNTENRINSLKLQAQIFQSSKCGICNNQLELPTVHLLCSHSFHQSCFEAYAESDSCPICLPEQLKWLQLVKIKERTENLNEKFHDQLQKTEDKFSVAAEVFSYGVFTEGLLLKSESYKD